MMMSQVVTPVIIAVYRTLYASCALFISDKDVSRNDSALTSTNPELYNMKIK